MKNIKYFFQFVCIIFLFLIFKIIGLKFASILSGNIFRLIGPLFRSNKIVFSNLEIAYPDIKKKEKKHISKKCGLIMEEFLLNIYI